MNVNQQLTGLPPCSICGAATPTESSARYHYAKMHKLIWRRNGNYLPLDEHKPRKRSPSKQPRLTCSECGKVFSMGGLIYHMRREHGLMYRANGQHEKTTSKVRWVNNRPVWGDSNSASPAPKPQRKSRRWGVYRANQPEAQPGPTPTPVVVDHPPVNFCPNCGVKLSKYNGQTNH